MQTTPYLAEPVSRDNNSDRENIVRVLLDNGADINCGALREASVRGHDNIVLLLLDGNAEINCGALQAASANGLENIVRLLLDKHADINARNDQYGSALEAASRENVSADCSEGEI